jgi:CBS domain-containing protein
MTTVQHLLDTKSHEIHFVHPDDTVLEALKMMNDKDIGAVLVKDDDRLVGIFTERHYARKVFLKGKSSPKTRVREVMETRCICVGCEQTAEACMALMTEKRIRHLPVLRDERLVGVISIGDLLKSIIADREFTIEQLEHFIHG